MATPNEKLAASLRGLKTLQAEGRRIFKSSELSRVHRERLLATGFLQEIIRGWVYSSDPRSGDGDSTAWYASIWAFCARYCEDRFGSDWHLTAPQSLMLYAENTVVPPQLLIASPQGGNNNQALPFQTSIYDFRERNPPPPRDLAMLDGLRLFSVDAALVRVVEGFYQDHPIEAQTCLSSLPSPTPILARLLDGGNSVVAGRLAGALRHVDRGDFADDIIKGMRSAGYRVVETNPFTKAPARIMRGASPIVARIRGLWEGARAQVIAAFPEPPGIPNDPPAYLGAIDDIYANDAYHSLSIEGYRVTPDLIERVRLGNWSLSDNEADRQSKDALAARGYYQAFTSVKQTVSKILAGRDPADGIINDIQAWYREMFQPFVQSGILKPSALAGYRGHPVYLRTSRYIPLRHERVPDAMEALCDLLTEEPHPAVRAVLGHWLIGYIHPYPDGNGRTARFLMNTMLASGGYPWTVIRVETREHYLSALDRASIDGDLQPFAKFVTECLEWSRKFGFPAS